MRGVLFGLLILFLLRVYWIVGIEFDKELREFLESNADVGLRENLMAIYLIPMAALGIVLRAMDKMEIEDKFKGHYVERVNEDDDS